MVIGARVWDLLFYIFKKQVRVVQQHNAIRYDLSPLSPLSSHRLRLVRRKVLVLDLDETLIHSRHAGLLRSSEDAGFPPDFILRVAIDNHPVRFLVHKRPHVDHFLSVVSQWFELVVFTASMEIYGKAVCDELDSGQGMLRRRYYRQHCTLLPPGDSESYSKDLSTVCGDLSRVFIIDNNPEAYTSYPDNAIPIRSWFSDPQDTALLQLLPLLDRLRRVSDVRTILRRPGLSDFSDSDSEE